jgi:hypothetical protein
MKQQRCTRASQCFRVGGALLLVWGLTDSTARSQDLEPRAYSPSPVGVNFFVAGYTRTTGGVVVDPSLPLSDVHAELDTGVIGYGHTFGILDRAASAAVAIPYVQGDVAGDVGENRRSVSRSGLGDVRLRLSVNLLGGEALTPAQFAVRKPRTTLGASLVVGAPVGQYDSSKLINLGANRWAFKPELGVSHPVGRWSLDAYAGMWLFTDNDNYFGGARREQDPIETYQAHVSYTFRPRLWLAADATYYRGGRTTVNGEENANLLSNSRVGLTLSIPIGAKQSLKLAWTDGATTRIGGDFTTYGVVWQYTWFDRQR